MFIGIGMLAPIVARPMASVLGRPLASLFGISGKLGRENSMRSPRRTAQTSSALMVGLALVSTIAVFGASLSKSATSSVDEAVSADYIITASGSGPGGFSNSVAPTAATVPGVTAVSTVYGGQFEVSGSLSSLTAVSSAHLPETVILRMVDGRGRPVTGRRRAADRLDHGEHQAPVGRLGGAGQIRRDGWLDDEGGRDVQAQRPARQLRRRRQLLPLPLRQSAPARRAGPDRGPGATSGRRWTAA